MTEVRDFPAERALRRSWYDYSWDWVIVCLFATVLLTGVGLWTFSDRPQTAAILEDATTGQSTR